jgi:hypothetical protein
MENTQKSIINRKFFLIAAFGHLLCWIGGDLLLFFQPNGFLDIQGLFDYEKTVLMLENANPLQFTISGIAGTVAMMLVFFGYYEIYKMLKPVSKKSAYVTLVGTLLTCIPGAIMHFTCTSMLWYFVKLGSTELAHQAMLSFFFENFATSIMCYIGVFLVTIPLLICVVRGKTSLPKWAWFVNTLPLTILMGIPFAGMGAMNLGSSLMFFGLFFLLGKYKPTEEE